MPRLMPVHDRQNNPVMKVETKSLTRERFGETERHHLAQSATRAGYGRRLLGIGEELEVEILCRLTGSFSRNGAPVVSLLHPTWNSSFIVGILATLWRCSQGLLALAALSWGRQQASQGDSFKGPPYGQTIRDQVQALPSEKDRIDSLRLDEPLQAQSTVPRRCNTVS